jgi:uncharacterized protein (DUF58 family)
VTAPVVATASSLRRMELLVTHRLDGLLAGDYHGLFAGPGTQPAEARLYEPGDDVRRMDWNLSARMGEPHVRTTEPDRELTTWIVVDGSASLDFGTARCEKRELALAATAAVGFLTAKAGNRVGAVVTGGPTLRVIRPRPGLAGVHSLLRAVANRPRHRAGAVTTVGAALATVDRLHRRRGLVAVVSDFHEPEWSKPLRRLSRRHQVIALAALDPREAELPAVGLLTLVDPETGRRFEVQSSSPKLRARYAEAAAAQARRRTEELRRSGASIVELSTDRDWLIDIVRHVAAGRRRRAGLSRSVVR